MQRLRAVLSEAPRAAAGRRASCRLQGVGIDAPSNPRCEHPVDRMIRVHAASQALAARNREQSAAGRASEPRDARQCRLVVNALKREIDRLRRGIDCVEIGDARLRSRPVDCEMGLEARLPDMPTSPPAARKAYAPDPLGKPAPAPEMPPPPPLRIISLDNHYHITNLGTLLDLLA